MQTSFIADDPDDLPIPCTITILQENRSIAGTIWAFYPHHCDVETQLPLTPGMTISVTLSVSGSAPPMKLAMGKVTWSRGTACGIAFPYSSSWIRLNQWQVPPHNLLPFPHRLGP